MNGLLQEVPTDWLDLSCGCGGNYIPGSDNCLNTPIKVSRLRLLGVNCRLLLPWKSVNFVLIKKV